MMKILTLFWIAKILGLKCDCGNFYRALKFVLFEELKEFFVKKLLKIFFFLIVLKPNESTIRSEISYGNMTDQALSYYNIIKHEKLKKKNFEVGPFLPNF